MRTRPLMLHALACGVLLAGCGDGDQSARTEAPQSAVVSDADAREALDDAVTVVHSGDLGQLCDISANHRMCTETLDELGRVSAPVESTPVITDSYALTPRRVPNGGGTAGGRVLEVCGLDGQGESYSTELLVILGSDAPVLVNAVYWSGHRFAGDDDVSSGPAGDGASASAEASMPNPEGSASPSQPPAPCP
jgi:hypothetical protein